VHVIPRIRTLEKVRFHLWIIAVLNVLMWVSVPLSFSVISLAAFADKGSSKLGGIALIPVIFLTAIPVAAGIKLVSFRQWARLVTMALAVLYLFYFPIGTILGVYVFWVLLQNETRRVFEEAGKIIAVSETVSK